MQIDFHFYTIYSLARAAGFIPDYAYKIAYSSQHTDDAIDPNALEFENGGRFQPVLTAHSLMDLESMSKKTCYQIWVPFHFLPGNLGVEFYERMLSRPGGAAAQKLLDDLLTSKPKPYILHRLGIFLHVYADTWSHQNFLGLKNRNLNDVKRLEIKGLKGAAKKHYFSNLKTQAAEYMLPELGHAQAGTIPDEPYREWRYANYQGRKFDISNIERALDAAHSCYQVLRKFLEQFPGFLNSNKSVIPWHDIAAKISLLFQENGGIDGRIEAWKKAISEEELGFKPEGRDINLNYDEKKWFTEAVEVETAKQIKKYIRKPGFEVSDWKCFHDAAAFHRFTVLHEVLPEHGMICG
jgi:hypothetical protein